MKSTSKRRYVGATVLGAGVLGLAASSAFAQERNPERNAYFGETHIHTSWSVDAWVMGNRITGPDDALKYAQGQTIKHPMGYDIKIDTPLDFMGVTDHSEYVGVTREANTPGSYVSKLPEAQPMIMKDPNSSAEQNRVFSYLLKLAASPPVKAFMNPKITSTVWKENVRIADENNHPGKFTAFCSYEWTSMPGNRNLHRNVFFRACDKVPDYPFSALDSKRPTDLWDWMDAQRKAGNELLAISHNANVSDGWMYPVDVDNTTGRPIDAAWAAARDRNERLVEIKQGKGQSETHPLLSPNDEFASYELYQAILGLPANVGRIDHITGSFGRQALKDGITMQDVRGYNPYKFGMAGGSDSTQHRQPLPPGQFLRPSRRCRWFGRTALCRRTHRRHHGRASGKPRRADRCVGGGEHARLPLGRDVPQGDFRRQRPAHQGALLRRLGLQQGHRERRRLGEAILRGRRADGRRPAAHAVGRKGHGPDIRRVGGQGPDLGQPRPHPDHQRLDAERPELREDLRRGLVRRPPARQVDAPGAGDPEHRGYREGDLHEQRRLGGAQGACGPTRSSMRACTRSTTCACWRFRLRAGRSSRR